MPIAGGCPPGGVRERQGPGPRGQDGQVRELVCAVKTHAQKQTLSTHEGQKQSAIWRRARIGQGEHVHRAYDAYPGKQPWDDLGCRPQNISKNTFVDAAGYQGNPGDIQKDEYNYRWQEDEKQRCKIHGSCVRKHGHILIVAWHNTTYISTVERWGQPYFRLPRAHTSAVSQVIDIVRVIVVGSMQPAESSN
ncbi:hypothetical protein VOLCADRAFT_107750 [Volvox carteri f. nagariensis]|uniref:Uncharacterized protein n=1 Tax=Volvox carteri f. nagariensis TaxID=3068 RepID=D8UG27_VOLCA|nr:uncharacterized protein VOLCADRAFT_107750 [Volvox carteri f. nagariensis]EFJ41304.1 hypothetical protein VOLCADRAFT_107750 [Volvox carteri f. nagariensis]|eukprot:XP_002957638.1 hypothetical protein VOLCADRAFT_107750 [Volvox carteri f. nagariensis]